MNPVLLDQGLSPTAAALLRSEGWDAHHTGEVGLDQADDLQILDWARQRGMACITFDHDFHTHLALARAETPSVILLRTQGMRADQQAKLIQSIWQACGDAIAAGAAISTNGVMFRIRRLPLK